MNFDFVRRPETDQGSGAQIPEREMHDQDRAQALSGIGRLRRFAVEADRGDGLDGHRDSGGIRRARSWLSRALRRCGRTRPRARAGAVLFDCLSLCGSASRRRFGRTEEAAAAEDRIRRSDRLSRAQRRAGRRATQDHPRELQGRQALRHQDRGRRRPGCGLRRRARACVGRGGRARLAACARRSQRRGCRAAQGRVARSVARHGGADLRQRQRRSARKSRRGLGDREPRGSNAPRS